MSQTADRAVAAGLHRATTKIKVCGVTTPASLEAVSSGVDYIGLNFWPQSRRYIRLKAATSLMAGLPDDVQMVALFVDPTRDEVGEVLDTGLVSLLQFHGDESPEFCQSFNHPFMKAIRLRNRDSVDSIGHYLTSPSDKVLVDAYVPGHVGGSGSPVDLDLARVARDQYPDARLFLAGGLNPDVVERAIAVVEPYAVDVASGVETAPGVKSEALVQAFIRAVRRAGSPR